MARSELTPEARREMDARQGIARQDMGAGLAGIFRPVVRGKRYYIEDLALQKWAGGKLLFSGPELDAGDLGVLLALLHLALAQGTGPVPGEQADQALVPEQKRVAANKAMDADVVDVQTGMAELCKLLGRDPNDGRAHASIKASIKRLSAVVLEARSVEAWATSHLISGAVGRGRGAVSAALSWRLTRAVLGEGSYGRVSLRTFAQLGPVAQCLYSWLCCWRPGHGQCPTISLDALSKHVWGEVAQGAKQRERRSQLREALAEIVAAAPDEWSAQIYGQTARLERGADSVAPPPQDRAGT